MTKVSIVVTALAMTTATLIVGMLKMMVMMIFAKEIRMPKMGILMLGNLMMLRLQEKILVEKAMKLIL